MADADSRTSRRTSKDSEVQGEPTKTGAPKTLTPCGKSMTSASYGNHKKACAACQTVSRFEEKFSSLLSVVNRLETELAEALKRVEKLETQGTQVREEVKQVKEVAAKTRTETRTVTATPPQNPNTELVINGLPYEGKSEDLKSIVTKIATLKEVNLPSNFRCFRALRRSEGKNPASPNKPPRVILQLYDNALKNLMKKRSETQLTLANLNCKRGTLTDTQMAQQFYINENLTPEQARLNYEARQFRKTHNFKFAWTSDGITLLRKAEGKPIHSIRSMDDLRRVKAQDDEEAQAAARQARE